jgi:hypothetical protein
MQYILPPAICGVMPNKKMDAHTPQAIRQKYSAALMSNHKWRKFFAVMSEVAPELCGMEYRFTDTDNVWVGSAPNSQQIWETAIDDPVQGCGGPVEYIHIESITIPKVFRFQAYEKAPFSERAQNLEPFIIALRKAGHFPITEKENTVVINGYEMA